MLDIVEQVIQKHPEVKNEGIPESASSSWHMATETKIYNFYQPVSA
jgi:hypothetical protein